MSFSRLKVSELIGNAPGAARAGSVQPSVSLCLRASDILRLVTQPVQRHSFATLSLALSNETRFPYTLVHPPGSRTEILKFAGRAGMLAEEALYLSNANRTINAPNSKEMTTFEAHVSAAVFVVVFSSQGLMSTEKFRFDNAEKAFKKNYIDGASPFLLHWLATVLGTKALQLARVLGYMPEQEDTV